MKKSFFTMLFAVLLAFPSVSYANKPNVPLSCVALGDSIAAHYGLPEAAGFVSILSGLLAEKGYVNNFENLAVNGYKTGDLLNLLDLQETQDVFRDASIVVISIGGNNVLLPAHEYITGSRYFDPYNETELVNAIKKAVKTMITGRLPEETASAMREGIDVLREDIPLIINIIKELSPYAEIFVYTIYNPFPKGFFLYDDAEELLLAANTEIRLASEACGYTVIDAYTAFANAEDKPVDFSIWTGFNIHPTAFGHEIIAEISAGAMERILFE